MLKNFLYLACFSAFVVVVVVGLDIYRSLSSSKLSPRTQRRIETISSKFDTKTIDCLRKRNTIPVSLVGKSRVTSEDSKETGDSPLNPLITITPTSPVASRSAVTITPTP